MPSINLAALNRPLPKLTHATMADFLGWLRDGFVILAPEKLRRRGWRPARRIVKGESILTLERSWLGETRLAPFRTEHNALPVDVALEPPLIFETSVDLPAAATRDIRRALEYRLDEVSPLPTEDIVFCVAAGAPHVGERLNAWVTIARRQRIADIINRYRGAPLRAIGAGLAPDGQLRHIFHLSQERSDKAAKKRVLSLSLLAVGVVILAAGAVSFMERRLEAARAIEASLIEEIKELRKRAAPILSLSETATPAALNGAAFETALENIDMATPSESFIEELHIKPEVTTLRGYIPETSPSLADLPLLETPMSRPGFEAFELSLDTRPPL